MESTPGRGSLNYGLILLLLALIVYAAIGLTLRVESVSGDELQGLDERAVEGLPTTPKTSIMPTGSTALP